MGSASYATQKPRTGAFVCYFLLHTFYLLLSTRIYLCRKCVIEKYAMTNMRPVIA